jgi:hypothetical protein
MIYGRVVTGISRAGYPDPFRRGPYTFDTCPGRGTSTYASSRHVSKPMDSPQRQERRDFRYPLHLPVLVRVAQRKALHARSENISLGGILVSSAFLIPEGSAVEVSIGVEHMPDPGILLSARGKVLRVQPKDTGDFSVAIQLEGAFRLPFSQPDSPSVSVAKKPRSTDSRENRIILHRRMNLGRAWHTET